jgi:hypothetical protein
MKVAEASPRHPGRPGRPLSISTAVARLGPERAYSNADRESAARGTGHAPDDGR